MSKRKPEATEPNEERLRIENLCARAEHVIRHLAGAGEFHHAGLVAAMQLELEFAARRLPMQVPPAEGPAAPAEGEPEKKKRGRGRPPKGSQDTKTVDLEAHIAEKGSNGAAPAAAAAAPEVKP